MSFPPLRKRTFLDFEGVLLKVSQANTLPTANTLLVRDENGNTSVNTLFANNIVSENFTVSGSQFEELTVLDSANIANNIFVGNAIVYGNITAASANVSGNIKAASLLVANANVTANLSSANIVVGNTLTSNNISTTSLLVANANVTANLSSANIVVSNTLTSNNISTTSLSVANANVTANLSSTNVVVSNTLTTSGFVSLSETITAAGNLSLHMDSIIDTTSTMGFTVVLPAFTNPMAVDNIKNIRLISRRAPMATVSCPFGSFLLTQSEPMRTLRWTQNKGGSYGTCWVCERCYGQSDIDSFFVTTSAAMFTANGAVGNASQGTSVAMSENGFTTALGGPGDNSNTGALWVVNYQQNFSNPSSQTKIVPTTSYSNQMLGYSLCMSADGNTLAIGSKGGSNNNNGQISVYTYSGDTWTAQATFPGSGTGNLLLGYSVSLSANGNLLAAGAPGLTSNLGSVQMYTLSSGTWNQTGTISAPANISGSGTCMFGSSVALSAQGTIIAIGAPQCKSNTGGVCIFQNYTSTTWINPVLLSASSLSTGAYQGYSVAISADGCTVAVGAPGANSNVGGVAIFTKSSTMSSSPEWVQQAFLVGSGSTGASMQGYALAMSADGHVLYVGGPGNSSNVGAVWIYTWSGGLWTQYGQCLTPTNTGGMPAFFGCSLATAGNGSVLIVGASLKNSNAGAVWMYT